MKSIILFSIIISLISCSQKEPKGEIRIINQKLMLKCDNNDSLVMYFTKVKLKLDKKFYQKNSFFNISNSFNQGVVYDLSFYINKDNKMLLDKITFNKESILFDNEVVLKRVYFDTNKNNCL